MNSIRNGVDPTCVSDDPEVQALIDAYPLRAHEVVWKALGLPVPPGVELVEFETDGGDSSNHSNSCTVS